MSTADCDWLGWYSDSEGVDSGNEPPWVSQAVYMAGMTGQNQNVSVIRACAQSMCVTGSYTWIDKKERYRDG